MFVHDGFVVCRHLVAEVAVGDERDDVLLALFNELVVFGLVAEVFLVEEYCRHLFQVCDVAAAFHEFFFRDANW